MNWFSAMPTSAPTTWIGLIYDLALLALIGFSVYQNRSLGKKTDAVEKKTDQSLENQGDMAKQLNGNTDRVGQVHEALGKALGNIEGAANEQARVATQTALATKEAIRLSGDDTPAYKGPAPR